MMSVPSNGRLVFITVRPIKKGEELFDSIESRKRECCGNDHQRLVCVCKLCKGIVKRPTFQQRREMSADPNFKCIMTIGKPSEWKAYDEEKLQSTIDKCVIFLERYGHVEWCNEIEKVIEIYRELVLTCFKKSIE